MDMRNFFEQKCKHNINPIIFLFSFFGERTSLSFYICNLEDEYTDFVILI